MNSKAESLASWEEGEKQREQRERYQRIKQLVGQALEYEPALRERFLDAACAGDAELREEVDSLIELDDEAERLVRRPIVDLRPVPYPASRVGSQIGPYHLEKLIGKGGLGEVYLAERREPFEDRVALKLIRGGMVSEEVIHRFELERKILANLRHPNIAQLFEGGATDDGQPYFVMEWIEGEPLDRYCDTYRLTIVERLRLFLDVCSAVQMAHQNLVVHRDLKPGNILVTEDGIPKLLDFGIAKLLPESELPHETLTRQGRSPMTRQWASPEQIKGEAVTTASDVYSLGVILYELLTGHPPYRLEGCDTLETMRRICEEDPPRPSTAIHAIEEYKTSGGKVTIDPETVSRHRSDTPVRLRRRLAGDLDSILLKALRKRPELRYSSVEQLADDIRRHLAGLPVLARDGTFIYLGSKFLKRYRRPVLGGAVLLVIAGVTAWQRNTALQLEEAVRSEWQASEREREYRIEFLGNLFMPADRDPLRKFTAKELLDRTRARLLDQELDDESLATQLDVLAHEYGRLGFEAEAFEILDQALELRRSVTPEDNVRLALALNNMAAWHDRHGNLAEAELLYQESLDMRHRLDVADDELAVPMSNLASILAKRGQYSSAKELYRRVLKIRLKAHDRSHERVANTLRGLGNTLFLNAELDEAEELLREVVEIWTREYGGNHSKTASAKSKLARILHAAGRHEPAEDLLQEVLSIRLEVLGQSHPHVALTRVDLAGVLLALRKPATASVLLDHALAVLREEGPATGVAHAESLWGALLMQEGRYAEAEGCLASGYLGLREARSPAAIQTREAYRRLVASYQARGLPLPVWLEELSRKDSAMR